MKSGFIPPRQYARILSRLAIPCVDLIITDGQSRRFILVRRKEHPVKGYFWIPGGRIFKGEKIFEAAIRKAKEELNLDIKPERIVGVYETVFPTGIQGVKGGTHTINIVVRARVSPNVAFQYDTYHSAARWFRKPPRDFQGYLTKALKDAGVLR